MYSDLQCRIALRAGVEEQASTQRGLQTQRCGPLREFSQDSRADRSVAGYVQSSTRTQLLAAAPACGRFSTSNPAAFFRHHRIGRRPAAGLRPVRPPSPLAGVGEPE